MTALNILRDDLKVGVASWAIASAVYIGVAQLDANLTLVFGVVAYRVYVSLNLISKFKNEVHNHE